MSQWVSRRFPLRSHPNVPLQVHARYSRLEIMAAFHPQPTAKVAAWQTGVHWIDGERADLFAFTRDKTSGQFSPTTRYRDSAISPSLIHWESQSVTRAESETGLRYRNHEQQGSSIMLFARERQDLRAFWFLGPATYVSHEGERPMAITWRLQYPLPGDPIRLICVSRCVARSLGALTPRGPNLAMPFAEGRATSSPTYASTQRRARRNLPGQVFRSCPYAPPCAVG